MPDLWYRMATPDGSEHALIKTDSLMVPYLLLPFGGREIPLDEDDLWAHWALIGSVLTGEHPAWAVGRIQPTDQYGEPIEEEKRV